jgi:signal transduction histidine kinase
LKRGLVTLQDVVAAAVESASPVINAARHALEVVTPDEPLLAVIDSERVSQVITNLLTNAAKYTPRGGEIRLNMSRDIDQAVIRVTDNGRAIAEDQLPRLFEMFMQANQQEPSQAGLGVGVAIAKRLVQLHDGSIEAHSAGAGRGSEFVVQLPLALTGSAAQTEPRQPLAVSAGRRLKVLVVDDNNDLVQMLEMTIERMGHEVRKALDGQSAISATL